MEGFNVDFSAAPDVAPPPTRGASPRAPTTIEGGIIVVINSSVTLTGINSYTCGTQIDGVLQLGDASQVQRCRRWLWGSGLTSRAAPSFSAH
jgi:hypothetical protein